MLLRLESLHGADCEYYRNNCECGGGSDLQNLHNSWCLHIYCKVVRVVKTFGIYKLLSKKERERERDVIRKHSRLEAHLNLSN
jgi:hypothetical protein